MDVDGDCDCDCDCGGVEVGMMLSGHSMMKGTYDV